MKRRITAVLAIVAVGAGVGLKLANRPATSTRLQDVRVVQGSERSYAGPSDALAGIRIRLSPSDLDDQRLATARDVPRIDVANE